MVFKKKYFLFVKLIFLLFYFQGCGNVDYKKVDKIQSKNNNLEINPLVEFNLNEDFNFNSLDCISVDNIIDKSGNTDFKNVDKKGLLRKSIYGVLSSKNFKIYNLKRFDYLKSENKNLSTIDLIKKIDCDAIIQGRIIEFKNKNYISYSITRVGVYLELVHKNGDVLWSSQHTAKSHEGNLPLDPISLVTGIYDASYNKKDEVAYQMIDTVSRRIFSTFPEKEFLNQNGNLNSIYVSNIDNLDDIIIKKNSDSFIEELLHDGKYEKAISLSYKEIEKNNKKSKYYYYLSRAYFYLTNYENAVEYSLSAIEEGYYESNIYSILGISYLKTNELKLAGDAFNKGYNYDPKSSLNNFNNGIYSELTSNYLNAGRYYFYSGIYSIDEGNSRRLYKSLKQLRKLRNFNTKINSYYIELGKKTSIYLKSLK